MAEIQFSRQEKQAIIARVQTFFEETLEQEIGQFDAEFLLDFFANEIGPYFYNRGLYDAQAILASRLDEVSDAILDLERATGFTRR